MWLYASHTPAKMFHLSLRGKQSVPQVCSEACTRVLKSELPQHFLNKAMCQNDLWSLFSNTSILPLPALPTRAFWSWWKRLWCCGNLGMCVFESSTGDVKTTTFRSLRLLCMVPLRHYLMALRAVFHPQAKGIFLATVSYLIQYIFLPSTLPPRDIILCIHLVVVSHTAL